jgi:hypothetical protein
LVARVVGTGAARAVTAAADCEGATVARWRSRHEAAEERRGPAGGTRNRRRGRLREQCGLLVDVAQRWHDRDGGGARHLDDIALHGDDVRILRREWIERHVRRDGLEHVHG